MPRKSRKNVGLIGLGIIGSRVAMGLRAAGFQVFVWNRSAKPAPNFLGSPAEIAESCEIIQIFVADAAALFDILEAMSEELTPRHIVICNATVGPESVLEAAKMVMDRGAKFLDAPFTGSKAAAEKRELVYYIGGDETTFLRAKPVLEASSKALVRIGGIGHASTVKVVTNMISAVTIQTLAEALAIVEKAGLPPEVLGLAIEHNACRSGVVEMKLPKMISGDFEPHFSLKHMFKDVQLGIHLANALNIEIPATTVTAGVLYGAINQGWADLDFSALYKAYAPAVPPAGFPSQAAPATAPDPLRALAEPKPIGGDLSPEKLAPAGAATMVSIPSTPSTAPIPLPALSLPVSASPLPPAASPFPLPAIPLSPLASSASVSDSPHPSSAESTLPTAPIPPLFASTPPLETPNPEPKASSIPALEKARVISPKSIPPLAGEEPGETKEGSGKKIEAVVAEFRDIPSEAESSDPDAEENLEEDAVIAPADGGESSPETPPRRPNFVRRWFVSRPRGS